MIANLQTKCYNHLPSGKGALMADNAVNSAGADAGVEEKGQEFA